MVAKFTGVLAFKSGLTRQPATNSNVSHLLEFVNVKTNHFKLKAYNYPRRISPPRALCL